MHVAVYNYSRGITGSAFSATRKGTSIRSPAFSAFPVLPTIVRFVFFWVAIAAFRAVVLAIIVWRTATWAVPRHVYFTFLPFGDSRTVSVSEVHPLQ